MIAKVNFNLISGEDKGMTYLFRTSNVKLRNGDVVVVDSQGKHQLANFLGYVNTSEINVNKNNPSKNIISRLSKSQLIQYWKTVEDRLLKDPLWMSDYAYEYYKNNFFFNKDISFEDARKKLTRNVILSRGFGESKPKVIGDLHVFFYGTMEIRVKGNEIIHIKKNEPNGKKFTKNKRKYQYLNEHFGLVGK